MTSFQNDVTPGETVPAVSGARAAEAESRIQTMIPPPREPDTLRLALVQAAAPNGTPETAREVALTQCSRAAALGADIALLPEMWSVGYRAGGAARLETDYLSAFREHARALSIAVAVTYLAATPTGARNALALIDRHGAPVLGYAKAHLCRGAPQEADLVPGDAPGVIDLDTRAGPVRVGAMICFDREMPEAGRLLALAGAELVLVPNACPLATCPAFGDIRIAQIRARAFEGLCFIGVANYPVGNGDGSDGHSLVCDPAGRVLARAGAGPALLTADLDIAGARGLRRSERWRLKARRPDLYAGLAAPAPGNIFTP